MKDNKSFLFDDFLEKLTDAGFYVGIDDRLIITSYLEKNNTKDFDIRQFKTFASALICQSEKEKNVFNRLFNDYVLQHEQSLSIKKQTVSEFLKEKEKIKKKRIKVIALASIIPLYILILLFARWYNTEPEPFERATPFSIHHFASNQPFETTVLGNDRNYSNSFFNQITFYCFQKNYILDSSIYVNWDMGDGSKYLKKFDVQHTYKDTGQKIISIHFHSSKQDTIHNDTIYVCEASPKNPLMQNDFIENKSDTIFIENPDKREIVWVFDEKDTIVNNLNFVTYKFSNSGSHKASFRYKNQNCNHDVNVMKLLVKDQQDFSLNAYQSEYKENKELRFTFWFKLFAVFLTTLLLLSILFWWFSDKVFSLFEKLSKNNDYLKEVNEPVFKGDRLPTNLHFEENTEAIKNEIWYKTLSNQLKRKFETDQQNLHIQKTIQSTIKNFDLFSPEYFSRTAKRSYLFLIDESYINSSQIPLFKHLTQKLIEQQVDLEVYFYFNNPLNVYQKSINHSINLNTLKNNFYNSVLLVFGDGYNFIDSLKPKVYEPFCNEFKYWDDRILITPKTSNDWSLNEKILAQFFHVLPADISGLLQVVDILKQEYQNQKIIFTKNYNTYSLTDIDFEDVNELRLYAGREDFFQWICSLAVYPFLEWSLILGLGETINSSLLTYENLLKLSRISWIHRGEFSSRIRLELLKKLSVENEVKARRKLVSMLEETEEIKDSYAANFKKMQLITNKFILYAHNPEQFSIYRKEEKEFLLLLQKNKINDVVLKVYLEKNDPDYPIDSKLENSVWDNALLNNKSLTDYNDEKLGINKLNKKNDIFKKMAKWASVFLAGFWVLFTVLSIFKPDNFIFEKLDFTNSKLVYPKFLNIEIVDNDCLTSFGNIANLKLVTEDSIYNISSFKSPLLTSIEDFKSLVNKNVRVEIGNSENRSLFTETTIIGDTIKLELKGNRCVSSKLKVGSIAYFYNNEGKIEDTTEIKNLLNGVGLPINFIPFSGIKPYNNQILFGDSVDKNKVYEVAKLLVEHKQPIRLVSSYNFGNGQNPNKLTGYDISIGYLQDNDTKKLTTERDLRCILFGECSVSKDTVQVQYSKYDQFSTADLLSKELRKQGFVVLNPALEKAIAKNEIRYYIEEKKSSAERIKQIAESTLKKKYNVNGFYVNSLPERNPNLIKVWIKDEKQLVYLQFYPESKRGEMLSFQNELNKSNFLAPGIEVKKYAAKSELRYFSEERKSEAEKLAVFSTAYFKQEIKAVFVDMPGLKSDQLGQLEVWINDESLTSQVCSSVKENGVYKIYFLYDKMNLNNQAIAFLDLVVTELYKNLDYQVQLNGYASSSNSSDYALSLSQKFCQNISSYLVTKGIDKKRINSVGYGKASEGKKVCDGLVEVVLVENKPNDISTNNAPAPKNPEAAPILLEIEKRYPYEFTQEDENKTIEFKNRNPNSAIEITINFNEKTSTEDGRLYLGRIANMFKSQISSLGYNSRRIVFVENKNASGNYISIHGIQKISDEELKSMYSNFITKSTDCVYMSYKEYQQSKAAVQDKITRADYERDKKKFLEDCNSNTGNK